MSDIDKKKLVTNYLIKKLYIHAMGTIVFVLAEINAFVLVMQSFHTDTHTYTHTKRNKANFCLCGYTFIITKLIID